MSLSESVSVTQVLYCILCNCLIMNKLKLAVVGFFVGLSLFLSQVNSAGLTYNYPLYPYSKDLSQTLTFKIMLRCAQPDQISNLDMSLVANYLRQIDCITRGIPKIVV